METVSLKCDSCGAPLVVSPSATAVDCEYCHSKVFIRRGRVIPKPRQQQKPKATKLWERKVFPGDAQRARPAPLPSQEDSGAHPVILLFVLLPAIVITLFVVQPALGVAFLALCGLMFGTGVCIWAHHRNRRP